MEEEYDYDYDGEDLEYEENIYIEPENEPNRTKYRFRPDIVEFFN